MSDMAIRDWPQGERPREKLLAHGAQGLSEAELLAIFFRTGIAGRSAVDLARDVLVRFGGLNALIAAPIMEFRRVRGLGEAKYAQLQAARPAPRAAGHRRTGWHAVGPPAAAGLDAPEPHLVRRRAA